MNPNEIESLRAFYVENRQPLYLYALSITRNRETAEDAISDVFERLLQRPRLPAELRPYVFRCVRNAAYDSRRRSRVRSDSIFDAPASPGSGAREDLEPLLQELPAPEREAIVLRIYGGLSLAEIAALQKAPLPTIASWYRRGLERLQARLKQET